MSVPQQQGVSEQDVLSELAAIRLELTNRTDDLNNQVRAARNENNHLRTELSHLQRNADSTTSASQTTPAETTPAETTPTETAPEPKQEEQRPRSRYPDVEPFDGEDLGNYRPFRINLYTKFLIDHQCFRSDEERILYAFGRLRTKASQRILPWVVAKTQRGGGANLNEFYQAMDKAFSDPEMQKRALVRVNTMKQGKRDLKEFLNEFDATMIDAGGLTWSEDQKNALLETAVSGRILQGTIGTDQPDSYEGFCSQLHRIDHQQQRVSKISRASTQAAFVRPNPATDNRHDTMDWEPTSAQVAALRGEVAALRSQNEKKTKRATWVANEEVQKRKTEKKCLRCGSQDHFVRQCPLLPARRPGLVAAVRTTDDHQGGVEQESDSSEKE